jgi:hypothetical protein
LPSGCTCLKTTFIQATKNLHQTLRLLKKISFIAGHDFIHFIVEAIAELKAQKGTLPPRHHPALQLCSSPNTLGVCPGTMDILNKRNSKPQISTLFLYQIIHTPVKKKRTFFEELSKFILEIFLKN